MEIKTEKPSAVCEMGARDGSLYLSLKLTKPNGFRVPRIEIKPVCEVPFILQVQSKGIIH